MKVVHIGCSKCDFKVIRPLTDFAAVRLSTYIFTEDGAECRFPIVNLSGFQCGICLSELAVKVKDE